MNPSVGDRWTRPGTPDTEVIRVTAMEVTVKHDGKEHVLTLADYLRRAAGSQRKGDTLVKNEDCYFE